MKLTRYIQNPKIRITLNFQIHELKERKGANVRKTCMNTYSGRGAENVQGSLNEKS